MQPRFIKDRDLMSFREILPTRFQLLVDLAVLTRQPVRSLLAMRWDNVQEFGIAAPRVRSSVVNKIGYTEEIKRVLTALRRVPPMIPRRYVFRLEDGHPVSLSEFNTIWKIYMRRWKAADKRRTAFKFDDIRIYTLASETAQSRGSRRRGH